MRIKGIMFPSYKEPPISKKLIGPIKREPSPVRSLPVGKSWIAHNGRKACLRRLKQNCREALQSKDPEIIKAIERLRGVTKENEGGTLFVISRAVEIYRLVETPIAETINEMIDQIEKETSKENPNEVQDV